MTSHAPHASRRRARTTRPIIRACRGTCIVFAKGKIGRGLVGGVGEVRVSWSNQTTNSPKARSIPASPFNQMAETYAFSSGTTMSEASKRLRKSCCCAGRRFSSKAAIGRTLNATTTISAAPERSAVKKNSTSPLLGFWFCSIDPHRAIPRERCPLSPQAGFDFLDLEVCATIH